MLFPLDQLFEVIINFFSAVIDLGRIVQEARVGGPNRASFDDPNQSGRVRVVINEPLRFHLCSQSEYGLTCDSLAAPVVQALQVGEQLATWRHAT